MRLPHAFTDMPKIGYIYGILLGISTAAMGVFVHNVKEEFSSPDVVVFRSFWLTLTLFPFVISDLKKLVTKQGLWLWGRSFFGAFGLYCFFSNFQQSSVSTALLLSSLSSLFVVVLSGIVFREVMAGWQLVGAFIVCGGVIALRVSGTVEMPEAVVIRGILGALASATAFLLLKKSTNFFRAPTIVFVMSLITFFSLIPFSSQFPQMLFKISDGDLFGVFAFSLATQLFLTLTYRELPSPVAAALSESAIFWGAAFDLIFFDIWLDVSAWIIYAIILVGLILARYERKAEMSEL